MEAAVDTPQSHPFVVAYHAEGELPSEEAIRTRFHQSNVVLLHRPQSLWPTATENKECVPLTRIVGYEHTGSESLKNCFVCNEEPAALDQDFSGGERRRAVARTVAEKFSARSYGEARDMLTWLNAYFDWMRSIDVHWHFRDTYAAIATSMDVINDMIGRDFTGRDSVVRQQKNFYSDNLDAGGTYCSWPYLPRRYEGSPDMHVHYILTRVPRTEEVVQYLVALLQPSGEFIRLVTEAESPASHSEQRTRRRLASRKRPPSPRPNADGTLPINGREADDPRVQRHNNMETNQASIQKRFTEERWPRLMIITSLPFLQRRPDYVFVRHKRYMNVFHMNLPDDAPDVYPNEVW